MLFHKGGPGLFHDGVVTTGPVGDKFHQWPRDGFDCFLLRRDQQNHIDAAVDLFDAWVACLGNPYADQEDCLAYLNRAKEEMKAVEEISELLRACLPQIS